MTRALQIWVASHDDQAIPPRVKLRIFDRYSGLCAECTRKLSPGRFAFDHIIALANGGKHAENNIQPLCTSPCHEKKTKADVAEKSEVYAKKAKHIGVRKPRTMTRWRKMNGDIVIASRDR